MSGLDTDISSATAAATAAADAAAADAAAVADALDEGAKQVTLFQILTGVFAGLALILMCVMIWLLVARGSGRSQPALEIQGGFSLGSLGSLMSTS